MPSLFPCAYGAREREREVSPCVELQEPPTAMRPDLSLSLCFCGDSRMGGGMHIIGGRGRIRMYAWGFATRASGGGGKLPDIFSQSTYPMVLG